MATHFPNIHGWTGAKKAPGDWLSALNARSQGLNDVYGLPKRIPGRAPKPTPVPAAPVDPYASARQGVDALLESMLASVQREKDAAYAQAQREAELEYQKGQALAEGLKALGISDAVQKAFGNAATAQAGLAQGYSGQMREQASAQAAEQARQLSGTGQEGAVRNQGEQMGNVQYGMGGAIPATSLNTMAAAFGADAALQPGFALQFGAINEALRRQQWADDELPQWTDKRLEILDQKPALVAKAIGDEDERLAQIQKLEQDAAEFAYKRKLDAANLGLKKQTAADKRRQAALDRKRDAQNDAWDRRIDAARIEQGDARISQGDARISQGDARLSQSAAALDLRAQQYADSNSQSWARIGVSDRNAQTSASRNELAWRKYKTGDKKGSGITSAQAQKFRRDAGGLASKAWNGVKETREIDGEKVTGTVNMTYQEAMREGLARGIPLSVMQTALNAYWRKPGLHAAWEKDSPGSGRPKVPFQMRQPKTIKNTRNVDAANPIVRDALAAGPESGIRYVFGAAGNGGFDCSGFTMQMVKRHTGVDLPHQARAQFYDPRGKKVPSQALAPGDVVFFRSSPNGQGDGPPYHCGYYIGNGKYVEYYWSGRPARVSSLSSRSDYMGARRFG